MFKNISKLRWTAHWLWATPNLYQYFCLLPQETSLVWRFCQVHQKLWNNIFLNQLKQVYKDISTSSFSLGTECLTILFSIWLLLTRTDNTFKFRYLKRPLLHNIAAYICEHYLGLKFHWFTWQISFLKMNT